MVRRIVALFALVAALATASVGPMSVAAQGAGDAEALDLAAMALLPSDLADADLPDFGFRINWYSTLEADAAAINSFQGGSDEDLVAVVEALEDAGWQQSYTSQLSAPTPEDTDVVAMTVYTAISVYADADGAAAGYDLLRQANTDSGFRTVRNAEEVGAQSVLTRYQGTESDGTEFQYLDLLFQIDRIHVELIIIDRTNEAPEEETLLALTEVLLERVEDGLDAPGTGLGLKALRLSGESVATNWDYYSRRDGDSFPDYAESNATVRSEDRSLEEWGITDVYYVAQTAPSPDGSTDDYLSYTMTIDGFASEEEAATFVEDWPAELAENANQSFEEIELVRQAPAVGDESTWVTYSWNRSEDAVANGYFVYIQVGDVVANIGIEAVAPIEEEAVEALATAVADCLAADVCAQLPLPDSLGGAGAGEDDEDTEPDDEGGIPSIPEDDDRAQTEPSEDEPAGDEPGEDDQTDATDDEEPTEEETVEIEFDSVEIELAEEGRSDVSGVATLTAADDRTTVELAVAGAAEDTEAVIHAGTCEDLDPEPAFQLRPLDDEGASETNVRASLDELLSDGYAIALHESNDDLSSPLACGEIVAP